MCGIIYFENTEAKTLFRSIKKRYFAQKTRGSRGFGFVSFDTNGGALHHIAHQADEEDILKDLESSLGNAMLFHHRYPTSTPNLKEASHPIIVKNRRLEHIYFIAHNGVITNSETLQEEHLKLGYDYTTEIITTTSYKTKEGVYTGEEELCFNDSEALAIELAEVIEGKKQKVEARGSIAFIALQASKEGKVLKMFYGRNTGNPLKFEANKNTFSLRSEGNGENIPTDILFSRNMITGEIIKTPLELQTSYGYSAKKEWNAEKCEWVEEKTEKKIGFDTNKINLLEEPKQRTLREEYDEDETVGIPSPYDYRDDEPVFSSKTLKDYREGRNVLKMTTQELLNFGISPQKVVELIEKDIDTVCEIEYNAEVLRNNEELADCAEILAELEDRLCELRLACKDIGIELDDMLDAEYEEQKAEEERNGIRF